MQEKTNKKAQFFVFFAVIIGALILGAASQINKFEHKTNSDDFKIRCLNYKNEIFEISKYAVLHDKDQEINYLNDFSNSFFNYLDEVYDAEMFYLYGNSSKISIFNNFNKPILARNSSTPISVNNLGEIASISGELIEIQTDKMTRTYRFNNDNAFYFLIKIEKEGDVYVCE